MWAESHELEGSFRKLNRAKEHLDSLRGELDAFRDREPYTWETEFEDYANEEREYTVYPVINEYPDPRLGIIAGDAIQNLRASLDHLVWKASGKRSNNTAFPITLTRRQWRRRSGRLLAGVQGATRTLIKSAQPYHWGAGRDEHPLAILQRLSNIDKHRTLLPVAFARRHEYVVHRGPVEFVGFTHISTKPIGEDTEVMRFVTRGEPPEEVNVDPYVSFEVTVENRTLGDLESVVQFVEFGILNRFDLT